MQLNVWKVVRVKSNPVFVHRRLSFNFASRPCSPPIEEPSIFLLLSLSTKMSIAKEGQRQSIQVEQGIFPMVDLADEIHIRYRRISAYACLFFPDVPVILCNLLMNSKYPYILNSRKRKIIFDFPKVHGRSFSMQSRR